jgi:hypothetical protein
MSKANRELLGQQQRASRETLLGLDAAASRTYGPRGTAPEPSRARVIDRAL